MNIGELFIALAFDVDETKLKSFSDKIGALTKDLGILGVEAAATVFAIAKFAQSSVDRAVGMKMLTDATDENREAVQKWANAMSIANPSWSFDEARQSIQGIDKALADINAGGGNVRAFQMLGIKWQGQTGTSVLDQLRASFPSQEKRLMAAGWTKQNITNWLTSMGVDQRAMQSLFLNDNDFEKFANSYNMTQKQQDSLFHLAQTVKLLDQSWEQFKTNMTADYAPQIETALAQIPVILDGIKTITKEIVSGFNTLNDATNGWLSTSLIVFAAFRVAFLASVLTPLGATVAVIATILQMVGEWKEFNEKGGKDESFLKKLHDSTNRNRFLEKGNWMGDVNDVIYKIFFANADKSGRSKFGGAGAGLEMNQTNNITVHGSSDPKETADTLKGLIGYAALRQVQQHINTNAK